MKVKGFTYNGDAKYKSNDFLDCTLVIERNEIVEFNNGFDVGIYPREYNSELSIIDKIYKTHKAKERIPNECKYYIQKSTKKGLLNVYLDINKLQYFRLKWGIKGYMIQSKDFIVGVLVGLVPFILDLIFSKT